MPVYHYTEEPVWFHMGARCEKCLWLRQAGAVPVSANAAFRTPSSADEGWRRGKRRTVRRHQCQTDVDCHEAGDIATRRGLPSGNSVFQEVGAGANSRQQNGAHKTICVSG